MLTVAFTSVLVSQHGRTVAWQRRESGASLAVTEGGMARALAQLMIPDNALLLTQNYDPIDPQTNTTYLGADGIPRSGDEGVTAIDDWTGYSATTGSMCGSGSSTITPNVAMSGSIGNTGRYRILAYRYNAFKQEGTLLVEGQQDGATSYVVMTLAIESADQDFPGVVSEGHVLLRGRTVGGRNGNIYYRASVSADPTLTDSADSDDAERPNYLNAIYSSATDGPSTDLVAGKIIACDVELTLPVDIPIDATFWGDLEDGDRLSAADSPYHIEEIELEGNDEVTIDTTDGPVTLYVTEEFSLEGRARLANIRTDGRPPQVGDVRIFVNNSVGEYTTPPIRVADQACLDTMFLYSTDDDLHLLGTGDGCPSQGISNVDGVVWVEDVISSINIDPHTRTIPTEDHDVTTTNGAISGINVPDDVSSLTDLAIALGYTPKHKFGYVKHWQRVRL